MLTLDCQAWPSCSACLPRPASIRLRRLTGVAYKGTFLKLAGCRGCFSKGLRSRPVAAFSPCPGSGKLLLTAKYLYDRTHLGKNLAGSRRCTFLKLAGCRGLRLNSVVAHMSCPPSILGRGSCPPLSSPCRMCPSQMSVGV